MVLKSSFIYNSVPKIRFGIGSIDESIDDLLTILGERIMLITDQGLTDIGLHRRLLEKMEEGGAPTILFDEVESDPSLSTVLTAISVAKNNSITGIIGFGGGSPMDVAKLTALICGSKENLNDVWGIGNAKGPRLPLCLIPTTAGTGSEVTPISIITIQGEEKRGVVSPIILPDLAVLDPTLTVGLPGPITAATGIDAMVHAIEAFSSKSSNNNYISQLMAKEALMLLNNSISLAVNNGKNIKARTNMLMGSMMAGMAFANSPVAAVHALAYPLGGKYHIPHGLSNALVLSEVLKFNSSNDTAAESYAKLAQIVCPNVNEVRSNRSEAIKFSKYFETLSKTLGLPLKLRELNIPERALKKLAKDAMKQTRLLANNPRPLTEADALKIYQSIW